MFRSQVGVLIEHASLVETAIDSKVSSQEAFGEKVGLDLFK